jgi:hypothetical protein
MNMATERRTGSRRKTYEDLHAEGLIIGEELRLKA